MKGDLAESVVSRLLSHAASHPDAPAIVDERRTVTYVEFSRMVLAAAARMHRFGVRAGHTVALSLGAREHATEWVCCLYAAGYLGAMALPLLPDFPSPRRRWLAERFAAQWFVDTEPKDAPTGSTMLALGDLTRATAASEASAPPRGDLPGQPFHYQFSSGTTGEPKVVLFSHQQLCAGSLATLGHYGLGAADRLLTAVPAPEKLGFLYLIRMLAAGGTLINLPLPGSRQALGELVGRLGITAACASPWQLRRLMQTAPDPGTGYRRLRALACIGAMVSADEVRAFREGLAPNLYVSYSSTECCGIALLAPQDDAGDGYAPYSDVDLQVVDARNAALPAGATGAIRVRVPSMAAAYVGNPAATERRFRDGWFYPGDAGYLDARGRLFVAGRDDGAINYGGAKIMPEEVEAALLTCPGVADAVVTSVPDAMAGEIPVAFVVLVPPATLEAVKAFCVERIDAASIPAAILSVERMPRATDGKVERARLKEYVRSHIVHSR